MIPLDTAQLHAAAGALLFPFIRILALLFSAPLLSQSSVPVRLRVAFALILAFAVASFEPGAVPLDSPAALLVAARESVIGFALGLMMRIVFAAAELAGDAIGLQMGLGFAFFVDPQGAGQTPLVGGLYVLVASLLFFALDVHLLLVRGVVESFAAFPVDAPMRSFAGWRAVVHAGGEVFRLGLAIGLPPIAGLMLANIALGMLSRSAPQLNLFAVGFPATLLAGLLVLTPSMPGAVEAISQALVNLPFGAGR